MIRGVDVTTEQPEVQTKIEPFLLEVADVVNTTLDLDTTLRRVAELVRKVVDYEIFAILLRSEEHTSELQSQSNLVCRLLLEKKKTTASTQDPEPQVEAQCKGLLNLDLIRSAAS